jgi:DNA-binding transcriptional MerR regulator
MHLFSIKDLEHLSGIKAHTIRIWEKRYSFSRPTRTDTNVRLYSIEELEKLLNICLLNKRGYRISKIDRMSAEDLQNALTDLKRSGAFDESVINKLLLEMFKLNVGQFEKTLNTYIHDKGIDACISNITYPFFKKIDLLQNEEYLNKGCGQLLSNIIRQKVIAGIEQQNILRKYNKTIIAFLPEGDHYEIELLLMSYLIKREGLNLIYLGANVPLKDVSTIAVYKKPDYVYTQLNNKSVYLKAERYLEKLSRLFYEYKIVITGTGLQFYRKKVPENIQLKPSLSEALRTVL